jgi:dTDP-4-amino-4,6-dideoxygalactose transaminase
MGPIPLVDLSMQHAILRTALDQAIADTIDRGDFVLGAALRQFEADFATVCGAAHCVGVGTGTDALALGLAACGVGPGDRVITPANTFMATILGILRTGARPVLVDCDPETALMDLAAAERAIDPQTKAIVPVHLYGQMVDPEALQALADRHRIIIFEDAAQAHLARRAGRVAGTVGRAAAFSFYPGKNLGAMGDAGAVLTNDPAIADRVRKFRNYGAPRKYFHEELGTNSRLDTLQAAVLNVKLPYLDRWNQERSTLAAAYDQRLADLADWGIQPIVNRAGAGHVYHLYVVRVLPHCRLDRDELLAALQQANIFAGIHYPIPCHRQPALASLGYGAGAFPVTEQLAGEILSLPMFPGLTIDQLDRVVDTITQAVRPQSAIA